MSLAYQPMTPGLESVADGMAGSWHMRQKVGLLMRRRRQVSAIATEGVYIWVASEALDDLQELSPSIHVMGVDALAEQVVKAGLMEWLIDKRS